MIFCTQQPPTPRIFGPALADALPPSGQEARPSAACSELVDVLSRATEKLALDWPDEPRESRASKLHFRSYREVLHRGWSGRYGPPHDGHPSGLPGGRPEGDGWRDRLDSWSREGTAQSHWLGSESHQAHTAATTLRVYVAAIAARRELDEIPLGRHRMVSAFMRGVRRLGRFAPRQFFLGTYQSSSKV